MLRKDYTFEVCANSVESCLAAQRGGADRVELCAAIPEGGTTPSFGAIAYARHNLDIKLNVIVRPRGGDFLYSPIEVATLLADIDTLRPLQVDGIVTGALTADGDIDLRLMEAVMDAAQGIPVTFHRAFDRCRRPQEALEQLISLGVKRVLTSGQQPTALEGATLLRQLVDQAAGRIIIMPGCGVRANNIAQIEAATGAKEFHTSARRVVYSQMTYRNEEVPMGSSAVTSEFETVQTDRREVALYV